MGPPCCTQADPWEHPNLTFHFRAGLKPAEKNWLESVANLKSQDMEDNQTIINQGEE